MKRFEVQGLLHKEAFFLLRRRAADTLGRGDWAGTGRSGGSLWGEGADRGKK